MVWRARRQRACWRPWERRSPPSSTRAARTDEVDRPWRVGAASRPDLGAVLDRGKRLVTASDPTAVVGLLAEPIDLVVFDRVGGASGNLAPLAGLDEIPRLRRGAQPGCMALDQRVGLTGPRAAETATELTVAAASGMLSAVRDERTGQPMKLGGQQSLLNTGQAAALAVLRRGRPCGRGHA